MPDGSDQSGLRDQLRVLALHDEGLEPSAATERLVMERWAERGGARTSATLPLLRRAHAAWAGRVAATAAAVAAIGLLTVVLPTDRTTSRDDGIGPAAIPAVASAPQGVTPAGPADPAVSGSATETVVPVSRPRPQTGTAGPAPVAVDNEPFVRLLPLMEEELGALRIARVRLHGPAATVLGLDGRFPTMGPDEFVEADVLLGEDGLARAIRFTR